MPKIIFLVGIPCSGKSTYTLDKKSKFIIISRDSIRLDIFGESYKQNSKDEERVTRVFNTNLIGYLYSGFDLIIDNTNLKKSYINDILSKIPNHINYEVEYKFFDCSLIKSFYRNIIRYFTTGKYIPFKVIYRMYKQYKKIDIKEFIK